MTDGQRATAHDLASALWNATITGTASAPLTDSHPELDSELAYRVQDTLVGFRLARGERIVGAKLGFTSAAMREQMNIDAPNRGWLTEAMVMLDEELDPDPLIHPRVEPEVCFILGTNLRGPGVQSRDVLSATSAVAPALEVVDTRFKDYQFTAADNIADNSSAAAVRVGCETPPNGLDLEAIGVVLERNGKVMYEATGAAALGHPAAAVAWLANDLADAPRALEPGDIVISGGLTPAVLLEHGDRVLARFDHLGDVAISVREPVVRCEAP